MAKQTRVDPKNRIVTGPGRWRRTTSTRRPEYVSGGNGYLPAGLEGKPCSVLSEKRKGGPRKNCPVQLTFVQGRPALRLCTKGEKPGNRVIVPANGAEANRVARTICERWAKTGKFPTASQLGLEDAGLGRARKRRR